MRDRACSFMNDFKNHKFLNEELNIQLAKKVCELFQDTQLPVRITVRI